jgi:hypothetical protein
MEMDSLERKELEEAIGSNGLIGLENFEAEDSVSDSSGKVTKWSQLKAYAIDDEITDAAFGEILDKQTVKVHSELGVGKTRTFIANSNLYLINALRNLPIMMFVLLPFFGLFLMLLHLRSKKFYVEHLIHAIHVHAFAYFLYGVGIVLIFNINSSEAQGWIFFLSFIAVSLYAFLSIKKVYKDGIFKAFLKFSVLGFIYFLFLMTAVSFELYLSLLLL